MGYNADILINFSELFIISLYQPDPCREILISGKITAIGVRWDLTVLKHTYYSIKINNNTFPFKTHPGLYGSVTVILAKSNKIQHEPCLSLLKPWALLCGQQMLENF